MKYLFLIASRDRPDMALRLIQQIYRLFPVSIKICLVNDGSQVDYNKVAKILSKTEGRYFKFDQPHGKERYWLVVDQLFKMAQQEEFDFCYKLDDDVVLHPKTFEVSTSIYQNLRNYKEKIMLNLWVDHRADEKVWTQISPKLTYLGDMKVRRVGWIDGGNWMTGPNAMAAINWSCPEPPEKWFSRPGDSSGVGKYLSKELSRKACRIYMPMESLIFHGEHPSIMHHYKDSKTRPITMKTKPWEK